MAILTGNTPLKRVINHAAFMRHKLRAGVVWEYEPYQSVGLNLKHVKIYKNLELGNIY